MILEINESIQSIRDFFNRNKKIVLKPTANGSSVGLFIVDQTSSFEKAIEKINQDQLGEYIAERFIEGRELTVGVFHSVKRL